MENIVSFIVQFSKEVWIGCQDGPADPKMSEIGTFKKDFLIILDVIDLESVNEGSEIYVVAVKCFVLEDVDNLL